MNSIADRTAAALDRAAVADGVAILAVSGGPDSLVLLETMVGLASTRRLELVVAHFDHGIHPDSAAVAERCARHAARHGLPFELGRGDLGPACGETRARAARLRWLESVRTTRGARWILTAHHQDDQVETVLMRFLRGSGPAGLAGIAERRGPWIRPLLTGTHQELLAQAAHLDPPAWTDPSNLDSRHLRGWLRSTVLPLLEARLPAVRAQLLRTRAASAEERQAWDELLTRTDALEYRSDRGGGSVAAVPLSGYSSAVLRALVRALGRRAGLTLGRSQVARVQALLAKGSTGRMVDLSGGAVAALEFGRLRLFRPAAHPTDYRAALPSGAGSSAVAGWRFDLTPEPAPMRIPRGGWTTWVAPTAQLTVRPWREGDRIRPIRGRGSRLVVRCMQDGKVPRHDRPGWPVLETDTEVVWVPGVCRSGALAPEPGADALRIDADPSS